MSATDVNYFLLDPAQSVNEISSRNFSIVLVFPEGADRCNLFLFDRYEIERDNFIVYSRI